MLNAVSFNHNHNDIPKAIFPCFDDLSDRSNVLVYRITHNTHVFSIFRIVHLLMCQVALDSIHFKGFHDAMDFGAFLKDDTYMTALLNN